MEDNNLGYENLSGPQKTAIFLLAMGEEFTSSFFEKLDEKSIHKIGKHMSEITYISSDILNMVMNDFSRSFDGESNLTVSGRDFLEQVVAKTLPEDTAREVFKVLGSEEVRSAPFSELVFIPSEKLVTRIKDEHPQTIALILTYLPQEKSAEILNLLPEEIKADIAIRILKIGQVQEEVVMELDETLKKDLSRVGGVSKRKFDGVDKLANILNEVDGKTEEYVLSQIDEEDSDLADQIRQKMFVFEDLLQVDDKSFREILQNVDNQGLVRALKTASEELREKIFSNLSERAAEMLKEDMEVLGPVRLKEVEEAQQNIIKIAKKLEAEGRIILVSKGGEDVFV